MENCYIIVEKYNRGMTKDVRVRKGPEISSNHYTAEATIRLIKEPGELC